MRIPSQFNGQNLYNRRGSVGDRHLAARKLARLTIALGLVILVMREAGRRELYAPFFAAQASPGVRAANPSAAVGVAARPTAVASGDIAAREETEESTVALEAWADVVDGATWRAGDFGLFYKLLQRAADVADDNSDTVPPLVGALPLLQQPKVYQGRQLRIAGSVARLQHRDAQPNDASLDHYWEVWIRPNGRGDRPILAVVPEIPQTWRQFNGQPLLRDGPTASIEGWFLKRLAYRSQAGADLAPVVIGSITSFPPEPGTESVTLSGAPETNRTLILGSIAAAVLIGISLAGFAMWRSSVNAARLRRLRGTGDSSSRQWLQNFQSEQRSR